MKSRKKRKGGIVYSTEHGRMCPGCSRPVADCTCKQESEMDRGDGIVRVGRETKGRKGKGVTLITGVPLAQEELKKLAKDLKQRCGAGGSVKKGIIEIQGDHLDLLVDYLREKGWTAKRSGG